MAGSRIRVTLKYVEILDRKDVDQYGEFVFEFAALIPQRNTRQETRIPDSGHLSLSDHPSMNRVSVNKVLFEGEVHDGETLVVEGSGKELDRLSADDQLTSYRREFSGPVDSWIGDHTPWDEGAADRRDTEQLGDWRLALSIERA